MTRSKRAAGGKGARRIERKLSRAWRRERLFWHGRGLAGSVVAVVLLVALDFALDWSLELAGPVRVALLVLEAVFLAGLLARVWWRHLRRYDPRRVALVVERLHPTLESLLISHVELRGRSATALGASPSLLAALHARAVEVAGPLDFRGIVDFRRLRALTLAALLGAGLLGASALVGVEFWAVFLERFLHPSSSLGYPTRTLLVEATGDLVIRRGDRAVVRAVAGGELPERGRIELRFEGTPSEWVELAPEGTRGETRAFRYEVDPCTHDFEYQFRLGDARAARHRVVAVPPPRIVESRLTLEPPRYTGLGRRVVDRLDVEVLEGTRVTWELTCDRALRSAALVVGGKETHPLEIDPADHRRARGRLGAGESFSYRFQWVGEAHGFRYDGRLLSSLRVIADRPPRVDLLEPADDLKGTKGREIALSFRARDDHGLAGAAIVWSIGEGEESRRSLGPIEGRAPVRVSWRPAQEIASLEAGQVLDFAVEVSDNRSREAGGPQVSRSRTMRLEVVTTEEYLEYIAERKKRLFESLEGVLREESQGSNNVKEILEESP